MIAWFCHFSQNTCLQEHNNFPVPIKNKSLYKLITNVLNSKQRKMDWYPQDQRKKLSNVTRVASLLYYWALPVYDCMILPLFHMDKKCWGEAGCKCETPYPQNLYMVVKVRTQTISIARFKEVPALAGVVWWYQSEVSTSKLCRIQWATKMTWVFSNSHRKFMIRCQLKMPR